MCKQGMEENFELSELRYHLRGSNGPPKATGACHRGAIGSQRREIPSGSGGFPQVPANRGGAFLTCTKASDWIKAALTSCPTASLPLELPLLALLGSISCCEIG